MDSFTGFYGQPYPGTGPQHAMNGYTQDETMSGIDPNAMDTTDMGQAQTLHQIISQNNEELMRRRNNYPPQYRHGSQDHGRRASMLEFSSNMDSDLADFQFDPNPNEANLAMAPSNMVPVQKALDPRKVRSREDLTLNTRFSQMNTSFDVMGNNFSPAVVASTSGPVEPSAAYMDPNMDMAMDYEPIPGALGAQGMHSRPMQEAMFTNSPMDQSYSLSYSAAHEPGGGSISPHVQNQMATMAQRMSSMPDSFSNPAQQPRRQASLSMAAGSGSTMASPAQLQRASSRRQSIDVQTPYSGKGSMSPNNKVAWQFVDRNSADGTPDPRAMNPPSLPHMPPVQGGQMAPSKFANAYSSSGFDMLGVLVSGYLPLLYTCLTSD